MNNRLAPLALFAAALAAGQDAPAAGPTPRPFLYGCGITWGAWLGLPPEQAMAFDRRSMDLIRDMGGTAVPANFAWIDVEPKPGEYHWDYVDHQVREARARGLEVFAYTGLTPDWALPANAPKQPGIGYRFPPDETFAPQFEAFFEALARRYSGQVRYYEFWNDPNGCGWTNDGCSNGHMAPTYVPWLKRWYAAMKRGDPDCVLAVGGLDYNEGVKEGWRYLEDIYTHGGGDSFDAVAIHPYGSPLHWQALRDTHACLVRHGQPGKKLWLNEYGWNTADEPAKAANLRAVLGELAKPEWSMVFMASYLVLTDLPETSDATGHDFGLCSRDRRAGTITPRESFAAFAALARAAP
ncbi:MAG: beta-galactosidase [Armatimonadetes bacterium]|nr:beta-galactosidase [Armatimonadota bacterium]